MNLPPRPGVYFIPSQFEPSNFGFRRIGRSWRKFGSNRLEAAAAAMAPDATHDIGDGLELAWENGWMQRFSFMPAVAPHYATGELLWTGYNPKFHWAGALAQSLFDAAFHNRTPRQIVITSLLAILTGAFAVCRFLARLPALGTLIPS